MQAYVDPEARVSRVIWSSPWNIERLFLRMLDFLVWRMLGMLTLLAPHIYPWLLHGPMLTNWVSGITSSARCE
jgi:hypothetical protein